ncbi:MAG: acetate--CoA ligase family protein [Acidimicrobiales bacterium]
MSLSSLLRPASIAVIGASDEPMSTRGRPLRLLRERGFPGRVIPVNPSRTEVQGLPAVARIADAGGDVDVALVVVPASSVVAVVEECAQAGVKNAVIVSSGFAEEGTDEGRAAQAHLSDIARSSGMRILGPNAQGLFNVYDKAPITFSPFVGADGGIPQLRPGPVAIVSQSGGLGFSLFHTGANSGIGFSYVVATGNEVDIECLEVAEEILEDPRTEVVVLLFEGLRDPLRLRPVAEKADLLGKHLIAAKLGRGNAGLRAAFSHTAHLAGADAVYQAIFRQLGIIHASDQDELLDLALALPGSPVMKGRRIGIVTTSGGTGVWLADALEAEGLSVPELPADLQARLMERMPSFGSAMNPIDLTADVVGSGGFADGVETLLSGNAVDAVVMCMALSHAALLRRERDQWKRLAAESDVPLVMYTRTLPSTESIEILREVGIPWCTTPRRAARLLCGLAESGEHRTSREQRSSAEAAAPWSEGEPLRNLPPYLHAHSSRIETSVKRFLKEFGLTVPEGELATSPAEAVAGSDHIGYPVALKVQSADLVHKSDLGLVVLNVADRATVGSKVTELLDHAASVAPGSDIAGVLVEAMAPRGVEAIVGVVVDPDFGPVVMVGSGGTLAEVITDVAWGVPPLSASDAVRMVRSLKLATLLDGTRGGGPFDIDALVSVIVQVSELAMTYRGSFDELDLNPVIVHARGVGATVADAWLGVGPA